MPGIFESEQEIKDYIIQASLNPENIRSTPHRERCLSYRNLPTKIGVTCYIIFNNKLLILERSPIVNHGGKWGIVSGYVDNLEIIHTSGEILRDHIIKEIQEEIGWELDDLMPLKYCNSHALIEPNVKIHFELFTLSISQDPPDIKLNPEHLSYRWIELAKITDLKQILITQFIEGLEKCNLLIPNA
jgi:8-oxo-dGTP pyrophosphatase MutT (NUDIX family)